MKALKIKLPLETELREKIFDALQGETIMAIMEMANIYNVPDVVHNILEGQSFRVDKKLMSRYYDIFYGVKELLAYDGDIDFYITSDTSINAWSYKGHREGEPDVINVNSGLLQLMNDDELRFVIGHEIGHLINGDSEMKHLVDFVFPEEAAMPLALRYKVQLWSQLAELEADRYGFVACQNLDQCVSAFFKMTTGLNLEQINMDIQTLIESNKERLKFFKGDTGYNSFEDHPVNPIRIEAINLFASYVQGKNIGKKMNELIKLLTKMPSTPVDYYLARFVASAGLIIANADNLVTEEEYNVIIGELSAFQLFPREYLQSFVDSNEDLFKEFEETTKKIMELDASRRPALLEFLITLAIVDRKIKKAEVELVFNIGVAYLHFTEVEIAQAFALKVQTEFTPKMQDIV
ncbi:MAG: M48 family metallopeptidase [Bacteroidales bacterium]|nr:M48 family metallopeptidase [Bacteroidales bacterium]